MEISKSSRLGIISIILLIALLGSLIGCSSAPAKPTTPATTTPTTTAPAPVVNWKMVTYDTSLQAIAASAYVAMAKTISDRTNGNFKIEVFPNGALGYSSADLQKVTSQNLIQIGEGMAGAVQGAPGFLVFSYDGLFKNVPDAQKGWMAVEPDLQKIAATFNSKLLGNVFRGIATVHTTKKALDTVDSFKAVKLRAWNSMAADLFAALGATPQSIPYAEHYTAMATGIVDGNTAANSTQVDTKDYEACKFTNLWPCDSTEMVDLVNLDAFNALPAQYQTVLTEEMKKTSAAIMDKYIAVDQDSIKTLASKGVTIVTPTPAELTKFMTICTDLQKKWSSAGGQQAIDIYNKVKAAIGY